MKGLILTCNTGGGHNSTAEAIRRQFLANGDVCDTAVALEFVSEKFSNFISGWHTRIYRFMPKLFNKGYASAEKLDAIIKNHSKKDRSMSYAASPALAEFINKGNYDIIICVHAFSAIMITALRKRKLLDIPAVFVATDYTCSPTVADTRLDLYFIPHRDLIEEFVSWGIPRKKIVASGLPVRPDFYTGGHKNAAKIMLGLPPEKKNITLMGGSMGCGPIKDIARDLAPWLPWEYILTVVCGTNEKLYKELAKYDLPNVNLIGFTKDVPLLMDASEFIMTKPGGITSTEGAVKHVPMLFLDVVGGCEEKNFSFFKEHGWAEGTSDKNELFGICMDLIRNPGRTEEMRKKLKQEFSGDPAEIIYSECKKAVLRR